MYISPRDRTRRIASTVHSHFIPTHCNMVFALGRRSRFFFLYFKRKKNYYHSIQNHYRLQRLWHEIFRKFILEFNILKACFKTITVIGGFLLRPVFAFESPVSCLLPLFSAERHLHRKTACPALSRMSPKRNWDGAPVLAFQTRYLIAPFLVAEPLSC